MRAFAAFFGLILLGLAGMAMLSYPAWLLLSPHFDFPFHRIAARIGMLILLVGFIAVARRMRVADRDSLGYGLPRRQFLRETLLGLLLGAATMLPAVLAMAALQLRIARPDFQLTLAALISIAAQGLLRGAAVSLIEETFLRGAMHSAMRREVSATTTIILTSLIFAALHFIGRYHIGAADVNAHSGIDMLEGTFAQLGDPLAIADAFLCLFGVGVLLGLVREITGNIAACIGLHAGWVWVITFVSETSARNDAHPLVWLLSRFDGVVGWLVLGWTIVLGFWLSRYYRRRSAQHGFRFALRSQDRRVN